MRQCAQTEWLSDKEYLKKFNQKAAQMRIPLSGSLALTHRCNMRCVHCYLGPQKNQSAMGKNEMNTNQVLSVINEITEAGCLNLLITGGEPLLRADFVDIYRHTKKKGLLVTVFSNGTLISHKILELFDDLPPHVIEITIYGATCATHERITGVKGSYEKCVRGIKQLLNHKVNVRLKTILMTYNQHEFFDMEDMAKNLGVKFRFDAAIFPCLNGEKAPISLRVSAKDAVEKEFSNEKRQKDWQNFFEKQKEAAVPDTRYNCGAGLTNFHIDPYGNLQPCVMTNKYKYSLLNGKFLAHWHNEIAHFRRQKVSDGYVCNQCKKRLLCGFCPAFFELENGSEEIHSGYLCAMGQYRFEQLAVAN